MIDFDEHLDQFRDAWVKAGHIAQRDDEGAINWRAEAWMERDGHEHHGPVCTGCELVLCCLCIPPEHIPVCPVVAVKQ